MLGIWWSSFLCTLLLIVILIQKSLILNPVRLLLLLYLTYPYMSIMLIFHNRCRWLWWGLLLMDLGFFPFLKIAQCLLILITVNIVIIRGGFWVRKVCCSLLFLNLRMLQWWVYYLGYFLWWRVRATLLLNLNEHLWLLLGTVLNDLLDVRKVDNLMLFIFTFNGWKVFFWFAPHRHSLMALRAAWLNHYEIVIWSSLLCRIISFEAVWILSCGNFLASLSIHNIDPGPWVFIFQKHILEIVLISGSLASNHLERGTQIFSCSSCWQ